MSLLFASSALADADRVLVVADQSGSLHRRVEAELRAVGLSVVRVELGHAPTLDELASLATEREAGAAIAIEPSSSGARVLLVDRITGKTTLRDVELSRDLDDSDAVLALRAVELLHASLLEVRWRRESHGTEAPTPTTIAIATPAEPAIRGGIELGAIVWAGAGGPPPFVQLRLGGVLWVDRWVVLALAFTAPLHPVTVSGQEGSADLWSITALASWRIPWLDRREWFQPYAGIGLLGLWLSARGRAIGGRSSSDPSGLTAGPAIELGARWRLSNNVGVQTNVFGSALIRPMTIVFDPREVTTLGPIVLGAWAGVDLLFD
jgi:hypothetical protein